MAIPSGAWKVFFCKFFFFSRNCASELRDAAVGSREGQRWVGEEENSQSSSSVMACLLTRIMDVLEAKARTEAGGKESDSLWPENPPCFHLNNNFKLCLPPLATVALIPVQSKTSVHQSSVGFQRFSAFLSKPRKKAGNSLSQSSRRPPLSRTPLLS